MIAVTASTSKVGDTIRVLIYDEEGNEINPEDVDAEIQWFADGVKITAATNAEYTVPTGDAGVVLSVEVTIGTETYPAKTAAVSEGVAEKLAVSIENSEPKVGDILAAIVTPDDAVVTYSWTAGDTVVGTEKELEVTADMLGKKITVRVTDNDTKETALSDATDAVTYDYPEIVTAVRKSANSFTLNFDSVAKGIVGVDDIEVISEDKTDVKKVTGLDFSEDGLSAVVTVSTSFKDGVLYNVNYQGSTGSFVASVGDVAKINIETDQAEVNTKTKIKFALIDGNGVDVTSAVKVDETCAVTFDGDYDNYENAKASNSTITMATEGDTCIVTITYYKSDGSDPVEGSGTITCVAAKEKKGDAYFKAAPADLNARSGCYRFYDPENSTDKNVTVAVGADKLVHFYAQDTDGSAISYDSYEIESADETIASVEIGKATGKWASFTVYGNTTGEVQLTLKATKNGAESIYNIPVTVTEPLAPVKAKVTLTPSKMSNAWDENYDGTVTVEVTAVDGNAADTNLYSTAAPELKTTGKGIDPDLKGQEIYENAFEAGVAGFQLIGNTYTAYAAEGGSYTIEAEVTDLTSGKILTARNTVTVQELPKEAWRTTNNTINVYAPKLFVDGNHDGFNDADGLSENDHYSLPWLDQEQYDELNATSIKPGFLSNKDEVQLKEEYTNAGGYNGNSTTAGKTVLMTASPAAILADEDAIIAAAAPNALADAEDIIRTTVKTEGTAVDPDDKTTWGNAGTSIKNNTLFVVGPDYSGLPGQDAYELALTLFVGNGVKATYAVELSRDSKTLSSKTLGFKNGKTDYMNANLYATMGGLFAGYVHEDGSIGEGYVLANRASRIVNNPAVGRTVKVQTYFGKNLIAEDNTLGDLDIYFTPLYNAGENGADFENAPRDVDGDELLYTSFDTVVDAPDDGILDFYTKQNEQVKHDEDFAREGTYKVEFSYWFASATKETKEGTNFTVKKDLYVPGVTVKSQTLDSYDQEGWKEAVVSEVDLNNDNPETYSVIDLVDKNGNRISDSKTAAHWVVIIENGIVFHKPLDRTFKLS